MLGLRVRTTRVLLTPEKKRKQQLRNAPVGLITKKGTENGKRVLCCCSKHVDNNVTWVWTKRVAGAPLVNYTNDGNLDREP